MPIPTGGLIFEHNPSCWLPSARERRQCRRGRLSTVLYVGAIAFLCLIPLDRSLLNTPYADVHQNASRGTGWQRAVVVLRSSINNFIRDMMSASKDTKDGRGSIW